MTMGQLQIDEAKLGQVLERVSERWDLRYRAPWPRWVVRCPVCGAEGVRSEAMGTDGELVMRACNYHARVNSPTAYRADVSLKCTRCSHVILFGIVVHEDAWRFGRKVGGVFDRRFIEIALANDGAIYDPWYPTTAQRETAEGE